MDQYISYYTRARVQVIYFHLAFHRQLKENGPSSYRTILQSSPRKKKLRHKVAHNRGAASRILRLGPPPDQREMGTQTQSRLKTRGKQATGWRGILNGSFLTDEKSLYGSRHRQDNRLAIDVVCA
jgi:hypothetical protein